MRNLAKPEGNHVSRADQLTYLLKKGVLVHRRTSRTLHLKGSTYKLLAFDRRLDIAFTERCLPQGDKPANVPSPRKILRNSRSSQ